MIVILKITKHLKSQWELKSTKACSIMVIIIENEHGEPSSKKKKKSEYEHWQKIIHNSSNPSQVSPPKKIHSKLST